MEKVLMDKRMRKEAPQLAGKRLDRLKGEGLPTSNATDRISRFFGRKHRKVESQ
jgi:hypothetical protein